jgi:hypothetical protein
MRVALALFTLAAVLPLALAYRDYPVITLVGPSRLVFGQAPEDYIDPGAECYDPVANSKHSVSMTDTYAVDLRKPGTYTVKYQCTSVGGTTATPATRTVVVDPKVYAFVLAAPFFSHSCL